MITLKSRREIGRMREAGQLVAQAHRLAWSMLEPGVRTGEIDAAVEGLFAEQGATPLFKGFPGEVPFPAVTCISVNEQVVHGIPGDRRIREGDVVSIDTACRLNGWCADAAWTYPVGRVDPLKRRLLEVGRRVLDLVIREAGRQSRWSNVVRPMQREVRRAGFSLVEEFVGHGIGQEMHEDPQIPNTLQERWGRQDFRLQPGLTLAVEPMINAGSRHVCLLDDGWTAETEDGRPSVHFEHTIALTDDGPLTLTEGIGEPQSGPAA